MDYTGLTFNHNISFSCTVTTTKIYCQASVILYWETVTRSIVDTPWDQPIWCGLIMRMHRFSKWILDLREVGEGGGGGGGTDLCTAKMCLS